MKTALSLIVVAALAGCATQRAPEPVATDSLGRYVFDYTVNGGKAAHLVQVFDDGSKTYVQFNGLAICPTSEAGPTPSSPGSIRGCPWLLPGRRQRSSTTASPLALLLLVRSAPHR